MGCGTSSVVPANSETQINNGQNNFSPKKPDTVKNGEVISEKHAQKQKMFSSDTNANQEDFTINNQVPKSVAFEVGFDNNHRILMKNPPRRLQKLEPLNLPKLTPEMLAEKQKHAEEKREKELQKRRSASRKASKRRRELMLAREFEKQQQQQEKIEEQQKAADIKREAKLEEVKERQRIKQERARRAREKAKRLNQDEPELDIDVEKDDHYNASDADSWLDEENNNNNQSHRAQSPTKRHQPGELRTTFSASTADSFDNAFSRNANTDTGLQGKTSQPDDFFDS